MAIEKQYPFYVYPVSGTYSHQSKAQTQHTIRTSRINFRKKLIDWRENNEKQPTEYMQFLTKNTNCI